MFPGTALYENFMRRTGLQDTIWEERIEDIMYFESDPALTKELILDFGRKLRTDYYQHLPQFADEITLIQRDDLRHEHADFLSRLGMTFSHGDYASIEAIPGKDAVAGRLYERALAYAPDQRAFLGLGIIRQKQGRHGEAISLLSEALQKFPKNKSIAICLGISFMNHGDYREALTQFQRFPDSREALHYANICIHALGDDTPR
jgi:tetratricopeptide (TPR) repeat protein